MVIVPELGSFPAVVEMEGGHATALLLVRPLQPLTGAVGSEVSIAEMRRHVEMADHDRRGPGRDGRLEGSQVAGPQPGEAGIEKRHHVVAVGGQDHARGVGH